jgi:hypothetical protein
MSDAVYGLRTAVFRLTTLHLADSCRIALTHIACAVAFFEGQGSPLSPVERRKSTVRKPSALSAMLANDFENRPVQGPSDQKEMEADYEWEGCFGKRAPVPHHRFVVSADCGFPSRSKMVAPGAGI